MKIKTYFFLFFACNGLLWTHTKVLQCKKCLNFKIDHNAFNVYLFLYGLQVYPIFQFFEWDLFPDFVSPVHFQQQSPQYYRQSSDENIKSESPSRKRRRLSRSGHHLDMQVVGPPSPPRRSPRQHPPSTSHHQMQVRLVLAVKLTNQIELINNYSTG